jgi:uncharacterized damage-inducible protein DinB
MSTIDMLNALFKHQAWADAAILQTVRARPEAGKDEKLHATLHHIVMVQRAFLSLFLGRPFDMQKELQAPESLDDLERLFRDSHSEELSFVSTLQEADLTRVIEMPWLDSRPSLAEALMQVVMHSQNHRGQSLSRLRTLGGDPPTLDFIIWLKERPAPKWSIE